MATNSTVLEDALTWASKSFQRRRELEDMLTCYGASECPKGKFKCGDYGSYGCYCGSERCCSEHGWCGQQDSHCTNTNNLNKGWGKQNDFKAYYRECLGLVPTPTPTATFAPKSDTKMDTMTLAIVVVTVALVVLSSIYFRRCRNDGRSADVDTEGIGLGTLPSDPSVMGSPTNAELATPESVELGVEGVKGDEELTGLVDAFRATTDVISAKEAIVALQGKVNLLPRAVVMANESIKVKNLGEAAMAVKGIIGEASWNAYCRPKYQDLAHAILSKMDRK